MGVDSEGVPWTSDDLKSPAERLREWEEEKARKNEKEQEIRRLEEAARSYHNKLDHIMFLLVM